MRVKVKVSQTSSTYLNVLTEKSKLNSRNLRNTSTDLRLQKKNSKNGQKCFSIRGARSWNGLSAECKQASSLTNFKKSCEIVNRRNCKLYIGNYHFAFRYRYL